MPTPNITAILAGLAGGLLLLIATAVGSYGFGKHVARGEQAEQEVVVANAYLEAGRRNAKAESDAALAVAKEREEARLAAAARKSKLAIEVAKDEALRHCALGAAVIDSLRQSVRAANINSKAATK